MFAWVTPEDVNENYLKISYSPDLYMLIDIDLKDGNVPTIITWSQGGTNVYVTGTFNNWKQKVRLNKRFVLSCGISSVS